MIKQSEALHIAVSNAKAVKAVGLANESDEILLALHALCEEQKRLLEQAWDALEDARLAPTACFPHGFHNRVFVLEEAISHHLRQQEGEK